MHICGRVVALYCDKMLLGVSLVPRAGLSAHTPAQKPGCNGFTGVPAAIPHPKVQHAAAQCH